MFPMPPMCGDLSVDMTSESLAIDLLGRSIAPLSEFYRITDDGSIRITDENDIRVVMTQN